MNFIGEILIENEIIGTKFACDTFKCKGACCTFKGSYGAPVLDSEINSIADSYQSAKKYLSQRSINEISKRGFVEGEKGNYTTCCIDDRDCVFVYYENDIARCSLEKAYLDGLTAFKKPLSCHLFPIRESTTKRNYLYFSEFSECKPALKNGEKKQILLTDYLKEALIRYKNEEWYNLLNNYVKFKNGKSNLESNT